MLPLRQDGNPPFSFFYNPIGPGPRPPLRLHLAHRDEAFRKGSSLRAVAAAPLPSKAPSHQQGRPRSSLPSLLPSPRGSQSSPAYTVSASDLQGDASPAPTPGPAALPSASSARGITGLVVRARGRASRHYNSHGAAGRRSRTNRGGRPPRGGSGLPPRGRGAEMADGVAGKDKCGEPRLVSLPLSRIRVIMKSSPEVSSINQEALVLTAKATVRRTARGGVRSGGRQWGPPGTVASRPALRARPSPAALPCTPRPARRPLPCARPRALLGAASLPSAARSPAPARPSPRPRASIPSYPARPRPAHSVPGLPRAPSAPPTPPSFGVSSSRVVGPQPQSLPSCRFRPLPLSWLWAPPLGRLSERARAFLPVFGAARPQVRISLSRAVVLQPEVLAPPRSFDLARGGRSCPGPGFSCTVSLAFTFPRVASGPCWLRPVSGVRTVRVRAVGGHVVLG